MSRPRAWIVLVRKVTRSTPDFLGPIGLVGRRWAARNFTEQQARKIVEHLERTHASYLFKAKPWGRRI